MSCWDRLVEEIIEVRGNVGRVRALFPSLDDVERFDYAHCITLDHKTVVVGKLVSSLDEPPLMGLQDNFRDLLETAHPESFSDLLLMVELYDGAMSGTLGLAELLDLISRKPPGIPVVDEVLAMSRGFLLWRHQLESLFGLFVEDTSHLPELCRGINQRRVEAFQLARSLKFSESLSLEDLIRERMVLNHVKVPNIHGANILYELKAGRW